MSTAIRNAPLAWFQRVVWLGIVANLALALPTLLVPGAHARRVSRCRPPRR